jgi:D-alanyl-D-alanine carboxypeptidase (penicillin-binding protein 5/6)
MFLKEFLKKNKEIIIMGIFVCVFFILFFYSISKKTEEFVVEKESKSIEKEKINYELLLNEINAKSFYVYDINTERAIFAKDEKLQLPLASITKLMSGLVILDILPETTIVRISREDISQEGDTGLIVDEDWKLKDLLDFTLITSSNDGMHALSSTVNSYESMDNKNVVGLMNEKAKKLGLENTIFINETGLDIDGSLSGAYSSAYDVSLLLKDIIKNNPVLISQTKNDLEKFVSESNISHIASNTNVSINRIPNLLISKTGFTDLAGGNLAIVFDAGFSYPIAIVVLGSTIEERFVDVEKLVKLTLQKLSE